MIVPEVVAPRRANARGPAHEECTRMQPETYNGRTLLLPDARAFSDVLEYLGEWDRDAEPEPRYVPEQTPEASAWERSAWHDDGRNRVGPYCTVDLRQAGG